MVATGPNVSRFRTGDRVTIVDIKDATRILVPPTADVEAAKAEGGIVHGGTRVSDAAPEAAYYVKPALIEMPAQTGPVLEETFAPILYVMRYSDFDDVIDASGDPDAPVLVWLNVPVT